MDAGRLFLLEQEVYHSTRCKTYLDGSVEIMACTRSVFKEKGYEDAAFSPKKSILSDNNCKKPPEMANVARSLRRAAAQLRDIALSNRFSYFVTLTLDATKIDRFDMKVIVKTLNQWLDNHVRRDGLQYVLVPERHKNGAIHFHGFFNDALRVVDSGHTDGGGHKVYNLPQWTYGFTTAIELYDDYHAAVSYCCKYVRKQQEKIGGRWYYAGGNLRKPVVTYPDISFEELAKSKSGYTFCAGGNTYIIERSRPVDGISRIKGSSKSAL